MTQRIKKVPSLLHDQFGKFLGFDITIFFIKSNQGGEFYDSITVYIHVQGAPLRSSSPHYNHHHRDLRSHQLHVHQNPPKVSELEVFLGKP